MTNIQQQMNYLAHAVYDEDYYIDIFVAAMNKHEMGIEGCAQYKYSDAKIIEMCNDFWLDLPDTPAIRREPFFLLCDIAEHCFDEEEQQ